MTEPILFLLALLLGLASGFVGGVATGGGLIAIPGLMLLGLPPSSAIATNNLNAVSSISSAFRFNKSTKLQINKLMPIIAVSFFGSLVGSKILLEINQLVAQKAFAIASIVLALSFAFSNNKLKKEFRFHNILGLIAVFLGSVFAGLFGTGGGFFIVYILCYFYGFSVMSANANTKIVNVVGTISVLFVFLQAGLINFELGIPMMIGSTIGGYIGAHVAIKKGDNLVKAIFLAIVCASSIKLLLL